MSHLLRRAISATAITAACAAAATGLPVPTPAAAAVPTGAVAAPAPGPVAAPRGWEPRPEQFPRTVTRTDLPIRMDDGVTLRGDLVLPADAQGKAVDRKWPVIVVITAYNKTVLSTGGGAILGGGADYLVKRGYAQLTVDARGTGTSNGVWEAFSARENKDAGAVVQWAHEQPWSNGKVGMAGASYMGISQLMAAGHRPDGLKAIFPQVPSADVYRDVVASGGQVDIGFIPLWMGLVTGTGLIPPAYAASDPGNAFKMLFDRLTTATSFTLPLLLQAVLGGDPAHDGPFYRERSPIEYLKGVKVPTFLVGGQYDIFQRGTPLVFERLQRNGAPVKMIVGPWDHLEGSSGAEVGDAGYGTLQELQLRWFDHWIKGRNGRLGQIAPVSYYEQGSGRWVRTKRWIAGDLSARSYRLSGRSAMGGVAGRLKVGKAKKGTSLLVPLPVSGLCTRSTNQWTAGIMNGFLGANPCLEDNALNDLTGLTFETAPVKKRVRFQGPLNARLYVSSPSGDGMLSVAIEDVAPNGKVHRITGGWQVIAHRKLARKKSRYLDGELIQAYHPFTRKAKGKLAPGRVAPVDVEIFPTGAVIRPGHRLRIAIQGYDVPHLIPPLPDLVGQSVPITLHTGPKHPSRITLPVR